MTTLEGRGVPSSAGQPSGSTTGVEAGATPLVFGPPAGLPRGRRVRFVDVPPRRCLAIEGVGEPGGQEFQAAVGALYSAIYPLVMLMRDHGLEAEVGPLEALWERAAGAAAWQPDESVAFDPGAWRWTLLIELPNAASDDDVASALAVARRRHPSPALARLLVLTVREGAAVEAIHVGPYATEPETLARMAAAIAAAGLETHGAHHEVYLGDPRRTRPDRLRTLLRQPVRLAGTG